MTLCFSYIFCSTVLMVCHNNTWVVVHSGCSGILGPWSHKGSRAFFGNHTKCFSYKFCCTVVMVCRNEAWVVASSCFWGPWSNKGPIWWNLTKYFFYILCSTVLMVCHNESWVVAPSGFWVITKTQNISGKESQSLLASCLGLVLVFVFQT